MKSHVFAIVYNSASPKLVRQFGSYMVDELAIQATEPGDKVLAIAFDHESGKPVFVEPSVLVRELQMFDMAHAENEQ